MAKTGVIIEGYDKVLRNIHRIPETARRGLTDALQYSALDVETRAKRLAPVKTKAETVLSRRHAGHSLASRRNLSQSIFAFLRASSANGSLTTRAPQPAQVCSLARVLNGEISTSPGSS